MLFIGLALLSLLLLATPAPGASPPPDDEPPIPPVVWELVELTGNDGRPVEIEDPSRYTVQFQPDGNLAIRADCNQATGTYTIEDGILEITPGMTTLVLCPPDSQADPFQDLLHSAERFEFDDDGHLTLISPEGNLRFHPALTGVVWQWQELQGGDGSIVAPDDPGRYTVTFLPDNELAILADCNRAQGTYSVDGVSLSLTIGGVTRAMCPAGSLMDPYLSDLDEASTYVFRDGNLYLALPMDAGIMTFEAHFVPPDTATPSPEATPQATPETR